MIPPAFILVRPQMGENIGAAARAMLNFGLERMRIVAPRDGWPNPAAVAMAAPLAALVWPAAPELKALSELINLGFFRGIMNQLEAIEKVQPECHGFVAAMQVLARQFEFEAMARQIDAQPVLLTTPSGVLP